MNTLTRVANAIRAGLMWLAGIAGIALPLLAWALHDSAVASRDLADRLAGLPGAFDAAMGETVLVEGRVAGSTPLLRKDFVAFRRIQRQGSYRTGTKDVTIATGKQPLGIATQAGLVTIVNDDYAFDDRIAEWAAEERLDTPAGLTEGAITLLGFMRGSPIVAIGRLEDRTTTPKAVARVRADTVAAEPREALVVRLRKGADRQAAAIPWLLLGAPLLLAFAYREGRRVFRS